MLGLQESVVVSPCAQAPHRRAYLEQFSFRLVRQLPGQLGRLQFELEVEILAKVVKSPCTLGVQLLQKLPKIRLPQAGAFRLQVVMG
jgi:hypothetical protein